MGHVFFCFLFTHLFLHCEHSAYIFVSISRTSSLTSYAGAVVPSPLGQMQAKFFFISRALPAQKLSILSSWKIEQARHVFVSAVGGRALEFYLD